MIQMMDLQVNGFGGIDFNQDSLTAEDLHKACVHLASQGVEAILATIITEKIEVMAHRLANLARLRLLDPQAQKIIAGFHIEGPFLNAEPGYRGAHPAEVIHPANADEMRRLLDAAQGLTRIVTLAPEADPGYNVTRMLAGQDITVSAGHCNPSLDELRAAIDAGLRMFTHLGNGCPRELPRHDNIIQRALSQADKLWLCFIADGIHVPFLALRNYLKCADVSRCIVVSDAMAAAGLGPGRYKLSRWEVTIGPDLAAWAPDRSHLVGSAITMRQSFANLIQHVGLTEADAVRLTSTNPRLAIGLVSS
jgi:N-acetylglucosamine-6-phosphate deacetylase